MDTLKQNKKLDTPHISAEEYKGKIDFGIITIKREEFEAVLQRFPAEIELSGSMNYNLCHVESFNLHKYNCVVVRSPRQGTNEALKTANSLIQDLEPRWILIVGIAGGEPTNDFSLGDVVLSNHIYDLDVTAQLPGGNIEYDINGGPVHNAVSVVISNLQERHVLGWNTNSSIIVERPLININELIFDDGIDIDWENKIISSLKYHFSSSGRVQPKYWDAGIASSNALIRNPDLIRSWKRFARRIQAVEMESSGVYTAVRTRTTTYPMLAIRGISDIIGFKRHPSWTDYACHTAASFAYSFIMSGPIEERLDTPEKGNEANINPI